MLKFIASAVGGALLLKAGSAVESYLAEPAKLEGNLKRLDEEEWFNALRKDYRYDHIMKHSSKVRKYLTNNKNVSLLMENPIEQKKFTELVNEEFEQLLKRK